ncbi:UDP-glucuronic acid epimerase [Campylobacter iguaniorum]|uniref:UDP-glucuronic acid epimerase n=1 Tax=Campylobacter iguaniorum TaxID=1244531 RepID=A0A076FB45_9BACT|nr:NAD-dependent epimerase [Campylobacter iguaniorum]AII15226.1 UDP-glucuronic acid epimerase [Campylobacter iguaniorum]ALV25149.1 UDP-glucuronic acid epimerase [Campylobacter iguaniorum]
MKILVTGMAGFIGFHLSLELARRGDEVVGLDCVNDYYDVNLKYARLNELGIKRQNIKENELIKSEKYPNLSFFKANLEDFDTMKKLFEAAKFDVVVNLAAQAGVRYSLINPHAYIDSNITGFVNILECCRHYAVQNLVYASSSSVYGLNENMPFSTHESVNHPISLYAATKKSNELMAHTYSHLFGLPTTGLRFFTVYGPWGRPDMALFLFTDAAVHDKSIDVYNYGKMLRDFTYVGDIVKGVIKCIDNPAGPNPKWNSKVPDPATSSAPYKVYNIGNNSPVELLDYIKAIELRLGKEINKNLMPIQPGDVPATYADVGDLVKDFDYKPNTSVNDGVAKFVDWYLDYYQIKG